MADLFSKGLTTLNVKTSTFLEEKKIQTYIAKLNAEVSALESDIGRIVYDAWSNGNEISAELLQEQLAEIGKKKQAIEEQTAAAAELVRMEKEILGKAEASKEAKAPGKIFCSNCGQGYDSPVKFCRKCGTKLG